MDIKNKKGLISIVGIGIAVILLVILLAFIRPMSSMIDIAVGGEECYNVTESGVGCSTQTTEYTCRNENQQCRWDAGGLNCASDFGLACIIMYFILPVIVIAVFSIMMDYLIMKGRQALVSQY